MLYKDKVLTIPVKISPEQLGNLHENIIASLINQTTGRCVEDVGYIEEICKILNVDNYKIQNRGGNCVFKVKCVAKVVQPTIEETVNAKVVCVMPDKGLHAEIGPLRIFAKWFPEMQRDVYEGKCYDFEILKTIHNYDHIVCVAKCILPN